MNFVQKFQGKINKVERKGLKDTLFRAKYNQLNP